MSRAKIITDKEGRFYGIEWVCPGCQLLHHQLDGLHILPVDWTPEGLQRSPNIRGTSWGFNGNLDRPTFTPSVLSRWNAWTGRDTPPRDCVCHSFVTDGRIQFLPDCTHALAGQTVDLPEIT